MIPLRFSYPAPSGVLVEPERITLALSGDGSRQVRFRGRIRENALHLRLALQALANVAWSGDHWDCFAWFGFGIDPAVTVHPDRVLFETFSLDAGAYASLSLSHTFFEPEGEIVCGTTNVHFTQWLNQALAEMRSSRETWLAIGGEASVRGMAFTRDVQLPGEWVRGLLGVQEAMTIPGTRFSVRPVDLLKAIRFLRQSRTNLAPRALRWEFEPGEPPRMVLEPWEEVISCKNSSHGYLESRVVRTWGRQRLALLESLLPYADVVDVFLKGRALPSFYALQLPGMTLLLGLSGWTQRSWSDGSSFELATRRDGRDLPRIDNALAYLREAKQATVDEVAAALGCDWETGNRLLVRLARRGCVMYDLERRTYRHRELFTGPLDDQTLFPADPRRERGLEHVTRKRVVVTHSAARVTKKRKLLPTPEGNIEREVIFNDWHLIGSVADQPRVEIVLNDEGKVIFGKCGCLFFKDNILNKGPCEHMIALLEVGEASRGGAGSTNEAPANDGPSP